MFIRLDNDHFDRTPNTEGLFYLYLNKLYGCFSESSLNFNVNRIVMDDTSGTLQTKCSIFHPKMVNFGRFNCPKWSVSKLTGTWPSSVCWSALEPMPFGGIETQLDRRKIEGNS